MPEAPMSGWAARPRCPTCPDPVFSTLVLLLLVGVLAWIGSDASSSSLKVVVQNPSDDARLVDVVWRSPGGAVSGSLIRTLEPAGTLRHSLRAGSTACVRWIDGGEGVVKGAWFVRTGPAASTVTLEPAAASDPEVGACPRDLVEHRVRPRLGRWWMPGEPDRVYRERLIPRGSPRSSSGSRGPGNERHALRS